MDRRLRLLTLLAAAALVAACAPSRTTSIVQTSPTDIVAADELLVRVGNTVRRVPVEEYVPGSAIAEIGPVGESPATVAHIFAVQSILARTYALAHLGRHRQDGFDLCDTTHCQVYAPDRLRSSRFAAAARKAGADTRGIVLAYGARISEALFHADCGGHTAAAEIVWGGDRVPYLIGTRDDVPPSTHREWTFDVTPSNLRDALVGDTTSNVGRRLTNITVARRDASGRAAQVTLRGDRVVSLRGEQLRAIMNRTFGTTAIQSTRFAVTRTAEGYRFAGTGFGHGVGLCQVGATARARRGESIDGILTTYYPGATAVRVRRPAGQAAHRPLGHLASLLESP